MTLTSREALIGDIRRYFDRHLVEDVAGTESCWPHTFSLRWPGSKAATMALSRDEFFVWRRSIGALADHPGIIVDATRRRIGGVMSDAPKSVTVRTIDAAAELVAEGTRLAKLRRRRDAVVGAFPNVDGGDLRHVLFVTRGWEDGEFDALVRVAKHLEADEVSGMTPREVPLPELNAKWLDSRGRRRLIELMIESGLELTERVWPTQIKYLDPRHRASGLRTFDSHVPGDTSRLQYDPSVLVIVENYDTFYGFPELEEGICVYGAGRQGMRNVPKLPWVGAVDHVVYWGDIDADGLEILDGYRVRGVDLTSVLMDVNAWRRYQDFGTDVSTGKRPLAGHRRRSLSQLTDDEMVLYNILTSPECNGHRRIEQERISYDDALEAIGEVVGRRDNSTG